MSPREWALLGVTPHSHGSWTSTQNLRPEPDDGKRDSAFGRIREDETLWQGWRFEQWQRDMTAHLYGDRWATWAETFFDRARAAEAAFGGHQPGESDTGTPDPGDKRPTQRVHHGDLPAYYIDAGATGAAVRISHVELMAEDDLRDKIDAFGQAAGVHAPWLRSHYDPDRMELVIGYQRAVITDLPAV